MVGGGANRKREGHIFPFQICSALEVQKRPTNLKQEKDEEIHIIVKCLQTKDKTFKTCE